MAPRRFIVVDERDNVATAVQSLPGGERLEIDLGVSGCPLVLLNAIPFGHKFALRYIAAGGPVIKYGQTVGSATEDIQPGAHVHVHNVEGIKGRGDKAASREQAP